MEYVFLLAERIVSNLKRELNSNKEDIGHYSFDKSVILNSSIDINFKNETSQIRFYLSTHPLDMPWTLKVKIDDISLNGEYEVYPNLLKNPDTLGNELAKKLAIAIVSHIKNNPQRI